MRPKRYALLTIPASFLLAAAALALVLGPIPIGGAIEFAADERFELVKGYIYMDWGQVSDRLWNDQPALYSAMLGAAFRLFGPVLLVARLIALAFAMLLSCNLALLVRREAGALGGAASAALLWMSPEMLALHVSLLPEVPAFALGTGSVVLLRLHSSVIRPWCLVGSGLLYSCALHVTLTALILLPAILAELLVLSARATEPPGLSFASRVNEAIRTLFLWIGSCCLGFTLLGTIPPGIRWEQLWFSHQLASQTARFRTWDAYRFSFDRLPSLHPEAVAGTVIGFFLLLWAGQWRELLFPVILGLSALIAYTLHRPWWWYYYLHLAVPMSILSAYALVPLTQIASVGLRHRSLSALARAGCAIVVLVFLASTSVREGGTRFYAQYRWLQSAPLAKNDGALRAMLRYKDQTRWFYSLDPQYAFLAGVRIPPELAILPAKRFATGQIDYSTILPYLRLYKPEQILLTSADELAPDWMAFVAEGYAKVYEDQWRTLYVSGLRVDKEQ